MPVGDRALSLMPDKVTKDRLQNFVLMCPRYLRAEIDDLVVRLHKYPDVEKMYLDICFSLGEAKGDAEAAAVEEAKALGGVVFRLMGVENDGIKGPIKGRIPKKKKEKKLTMQRLRNVEEVMQLRQVLNNIKTGWYLEFLAMDAEKCDTLVASFTKMTSLEKEELLAVAKFLPEGLLQLQRIIESPSDGWAPPHQRNPHEGRTGAGAAGNVPGKRGKPGLQSGRDRLKDLKRRDHQHQMLLYEGRDPFARGGVGGHPYQGNDPDKTREFMAPPVSKGEVMEIGAMGQSRHFRLDDAIGPGGKFAPGENSEVMWVDSLSEAMGIRPFPAVPLDTTHLSPEARREVYAYIAEHGNQQNVVHDKVFTEKLAAFKQNQDLMWAKGRWWAKEAEQRKLHAVMLKSQEIAEKIRLRERAAAQEAEAAEAGKSKRRAEMEAAADKTKELLAALGSDKKWAANKRRQDAREAAERRLMADLQTKQGFFDEPSAGGEGSEVGQRQLDGKSYLLKEWSSTGLPLTAAAAATTFGTTPYEDRSKDVPLEIEEWREEAVREELVLERRKKLREAQDRRAAQNKLNMEISDWRAQVSVGFMRYGGTDSASRRWLIFVFYRYYYPSWELI